MKERVLDIDLERMRLGELSEDESKRLLELLVAADGDTSRLDERIREDESFLEKNPATATMPFITKKLQRGTPSYMSYEENMYQPKMFRRNENSNAHRSSFIRVFAVAVGLLVSTLLLWSILSEKKNAVELEPDQSKELHVSRVQMPSDFSKNDRVGAVPDASRFEKDFREIEQIVERNEQDSSIFKFQMFYENYQLKDQPDKELWFYDQYASLLEYAGLDGFSYTDKNGKEKVKDLPKPSFLRQEITRFYNTLAEAEKKDIKLGRSAVARSLYKISEKEFSEMIAIRITSSDEDTLKHALRAKQTKLRRVEERLASLIELGLPQWSVSAHYRLATAYQDSADSIRQSYVPPRLTPKQTVEYQAILEKTARQIDKQALSHLREAINISRAGNWNSKIATESKLLYQRLRSKICPEPQNIDVLREAMSLVKEKEYASLRFRETKTFLKKREHQLAEYYPSIKKFRQQFSALSPRCDEQFRNSSLRTKAACEKKHVAIRQTLEALKTEMTNDICTHEVPLVNDREYARSDVSSSENGSSTKSVSKGETLERKAIRDTIKTYRREVRNCYEIGLRTNPKLEGDVKISFKISKKGSVIDATVSSSAIEIADVGKCLTKAAKKWTFPESDKGIRVFDYPFHFRPE